MRDLEDRIALVTGGAHNVGRAIVRELASRGAHVIINFFHSPAKARETHAELEELGVRVDLIRASVARSDQVARMFEEIEQRHGRLDVLINSAASGALLPMDSITEEHLDRAYATDVKGALWCAQHAAPLMTRRGGAIVNVSALGGSQLVMANYLACAPAKAGLEALTRYLAVEFAPRNIRVNTASAAMLVSEVADRFPRASEMQQVIRDATPMRRLGTPEEFARVIGFLVSDQSSWINGQTLLADGGLSLGATMLSPRAPSGRDLAPVAEPAPSPRPATAVSPRLPEDAPDEIASDAIAVVGMGLVVAGATSPEEYWRLRLDGRELFVPVPPDRWDRTAFYSPDPSAQDKSYQDRSVFITDFPPDAGTIRCDDQDEHTTAWLRHSLIQALRAPAVRDDDRTALVLGYTPDGNQHLEEAGVLAAVADRAKRVAADLQLSPQKRALLLREIHETLAVRYHRGAGPEPFRFLPHHVGRRAMTGLLPADTEVLMVDTACSSSLYAIDIAAKGLRQNDHDVAVCGGAFALSPRTTLLFAKLRGLSRRGDIRALDRAADGVIFADGAAVVTLKRLRRAIRDGDPVLAVLPGLGTSSDGRGKAIYAPSVAGQDRAVTRAWPNGRPGPIDWIVAHATGTPTGDLTEFATLRRRYGDQLIPVTSNKSLIGHTGWPAGVLSLIEVILGLQAQTIPPQHRFTEPPPEFGVPGDTKLRIPTEPVSWPSRADRPRRAAVSGFGFGGTNAHLLVEEHRPDHPLPIAPAHLVRSRRLAIVAWAAHLPGLTDRAAVQRWLRGGAPGPDDSFGEAYPTPPRGRVRLPPPALRTVDRCQLMIVECAAGLPGGLSTVLAQHSERTGVFIGHTGPTRAAMLYADRCYADDVEQALMANPRLAGEPETPGLLERLCVELRRGVPPANEDSFPGIMPNVIAARLANHLDLHGPNLTVDTGLASTLSACILAARYLRAGDIDVALVGGVNGNTLPELRAFLPSRVTEPAEGAVLLTIMTEELAVQAGLPILARLGEPGSAAATENCDGVPHSRYLGAAGALAILRALHRHTGSVDVICPSEHHPGTTRIALTVMGGDTGGPPAHNREAAAPASRRPTLISRYIPQLTIEPAPGNGQGVPFLPADVLVLTDRPALIEALGDLPPNSLVLNCGPDDRCSAHLPVVTESALHAAVNGKRYRHLRIVTDLSGVDLGDPSPPVIALHDLAFLAVQRCLAEPRGGSVITVLLGALPSGTPHPYVGLFGGLAKATHLELPGVVVFALATSTDDIRAAARAAERETAVVRTAPPVVFDRDGQRQVVTLVHQEVAAPDKVPPVLGPRSVVVAVGGARGIAAEVVTALASRFRPVIYLLGSNPLDRYAPEVFAGEDPQFLSRRPQWIRQRLAAEPGVTVAALNDEFNRMVNARAARRNIDRMARYCGADRIHYLTCDVLDRDAVTEAIDSVLAAEAGIDLLINAAGRNRSAPLAGKSIEEFRIIRDLKLRGYLNLKHALRDRPPIRWCNFGSLLGFFGQRGETDYASGNDFLATAACYATSALGADEVTIGWSLWRDTGLGANELTSAYYQREGLYTGMDADEGVDHFLRELHSPEHAAHIVHLGAAERRTVDRLYPGFFRNRHTDDSRRAPLLGSPLARTARAATFEHTFDHKSHPYLGHHRVRGLPTLPGTFVTEIAAQAARLLVDDRRVIGFADLRLDRFLHLYENLPPATKRIHAEIVDRSGDLVTVLVRLTGDILTRDHRVLASDRPHASVRVLLADAFPPAPLWNQEQPDQNAVPVPDPYHDPASPVVLTGPFITTTRTRVHPGGTRARFAPPSAGELAGVLSSFTIPCLLLDGMARLSVLDLGDGRPPVAVPSAVERIELYQDANDLTLASAADPIELYGSPAALSTTRNHITAVGPDCRIMARISGLKAVLLDGSGQAVQDPRGRDETGDASTSHTLIQARWADSTGRRNTLDRGWNDGWTKAEAGSGVSRADALAGTSDGSAAP